MGNSKLGTKAVLKSSGIKKKNAPKRAIKRSSRNHSTGTNESTGKTFLVINQGPVLTLAGTYNTRYEARKNKKEGQLVILASRLPGKLKSEKREPRYVTIKKQVVNTAGETVTKKKKVRKGWKYSKWLTSEVGECLNPWLV